MSTLSHENLVVSGQLKMPTPRGIASDVPPTGTCIVSLKSPQRAVFFLEDESGTSWLTLVFVKRNHP